MDSNQFATIPPLKHIILPSQDTRFCRDCHWMKIHGELYITNCMYCTHPKQQIDKVRGEALQSNCGVQRTPLNSPNHCNDRGDWYQARKTPT